MRRLHRAGRLAGWLTLFLMAGAGSLALLAALALRGDAWWATLRAQDDRLPLVAVLLVALVLPMAALALRLGRTLSPASQPGPRAAAAVVVAPDDRLGATAPRVLHAVERPEHEPAPRRRPEPTREPAGRHRPRLRTRSR